MKDIINYLLEDEDFKKIVNDHGDGRKTTKKVGSVMTTFSITSEGARSPSKEYCLSICNGEFIY